MKRTTLWFGTLAALLLALSACQESAYQRTLDRELARGERNDSIFLGIHFGMNARDFYAHCWNLNRDSLIRQGPNNLSVQYIVPGDFRDKVYMHFYPRFTQDEERLIWEMPVLFSYEAWSIWNNTYGADSLLPEVLALFDSWYGGDFLKIEHPERGVAYVKIQGNRRVLVHRKDDQYVQAMITDMLARDTVQGPRPPVTGRPVIPSLRNQSSL